MTPSAQRGSLFVGGAGALIAIVLTVGGRMLIGVHASSVQTAAPETVLTVSTVPLIQVTGYERTGRYLGLVESKRQTDLAFESAGTLLQMLVEEGDDVKQGHIVAKLDTRALEAERFSQHASRAALVSDLERAQLSLERQRELESQNFTTGKSIDDARLLVSRSKALIKQADAVIVAIEVSLDKAAIKAPFDAKVGEQNIDVGSTVIAGQPVASLFESAAPVVRIGLPVELISALPLGSLQSIAIAGINYPSTVMSVRTDVSAITRTLDVRLQIDTTNLIQPAFGQTAELRLQQRIEQTGYRVPVGALTEGELGLWSLMLSVYNEPDSTTGHVVREHVDILHTDGENAYVIGDLPTSAEVIQSGLHRVVAGQQVRNQTNAQ